VTRYYYHDAPSLLRQLHWLKVPRRIYYKLAVLVYKMFSWPGTVIPRWRTSSSSRVGVSKASVFCFVSRTVLFPVHDSQPTATELFQSPLYGFGTIFRSVWHLICHFPSSAVAWRHTTSNSVSRNYCCRARKVTLSFTDTLIALTYLLIKKNPLRSPDVVVLQITILFHVC